MPAKAPNNNHPSGLSPRPTATEIPKMEPVKNDQTSFAKRLFFKISVSEKAIVVMEPASFVTSRAISLLLERVLADIASAKGYFTNKKLPCKNEGVSYLVETRGIDVPSKDGGCGGPVCIFRL